MFQRQSQILRFEKKLMRMDMHIAKIIYIPRIKRLKGVPLGFLTQFYRNIYAKKVLFKEKCLKGDL